jgi:hypothetical protein
MTAVAQPWLNRSLGAAVVRVPLRLARCPGCAIDPVHPTARTCDRIGCPLKHMSSAIHNGGNN